MARTPTGDTVGTPTGDTVGTRAGTGTGLRVAAWTLLLALVVVGTVGAARLAGFDLQRFLPGGAPVSTVTGAEGAGQEDRPTEDPDGSAEQPDPPSHGGDDELLGTVQGLVDARALAWEEGDPDLLTSVTAVGSPALETERQALDRARERGVSYADVDFRVERALLVDEEGGRLTVDAAVTRAPLTGADKEGETLVEEPETTEQVRLVLARGETGWLLWSWAPQEEGSTR